uniref:NGFI-A binding protein 2 n=1 Tax=Latimeria chalumnae TaxID=7897 RepID=H3BHM6_LATCH
RNGASLSAMSLPRTLGELQLYRVLQRANLLSYYDTFIQQGGDDVQQLCEAGEEEFLEIMALVGMATKPLHVRRLQKALREWATNPAVFNQPLASVPVSSIPLFKISETMGRKSITNGNGHANLHEDQGKIRSFSPKSPSELGEKLSPMQLPHEARFWQGRLTPDPDGNATEDERTSPLSPAEMSVKLDPDTLLAISESVDRLIKTVPRSDANEVKTLLKMNKKLAKTVGHIFELDSKNSLKEEEIRKYSIIYGRFDSKRREGKQLTQHELTINEAAAQFCMRDTTLLLRRVELFSLARQVARECTYVSSLKNSRSIAEEATGPQPKKLKQEAMVTSPHGHAEGMAQTGSESYGPAFRHSTEEDSASLSEESVDSHLQGPSSCPRLSPSPNASSDVSVNLTAHSNWSRQLLQQTLMDEGLRLARLVSHDHVVGRLSPCLPGKPPVPEYEESGADSCRPIPTAREKRRSSSKEEQDNKGLTQTQ